MKKSQIVGTLLKETNETAGNANKKEASVKLGSSLLIIFLATVISGSIPFVQAHFAKNTPQPLGLVQEQTEVQVPAEGLDPFLWSAKLKIEDLKLHHRLSLEIKSDNYIEISGTISSEEETRWIEFLTWYEAKHGFPKLSHNVSATAVSGNIPQLQSVWFNANPTVYFQDGSFGEVGSIIQDGWMIKSIETWAVQVIRDGATVTLSYQ